MTKPFSLLKAWLSRFIASNSPAILVIFCLTLSCSGQERNIATAGNISDKASKTEMDNNTHSCIAAAKPCDATVFYPSSGKDWYSRLAAATDRSFLTAYFKSCDYDPGPDAFVLAARIDEESDKRLAYRFFSLGDSAFTFSMAKDGSERFWPASTVKLAASLLALIRAESLGIGLDDPIHFKDLDISHQSDLRTLIREAIVPSLNPPYNALMLFVGLDRANLDYLRTLLHFPTMILQRRYERTRDDDNLRLSPPFEVETKKGRLELASEKSLHFFPEAPRESNATTLAELAEWMRRAVLAHETLPISEASLNYVKQCLLEAPSCIGQAVSKVLGHTAKVYNKGGRVIGDDRLELAVIIDEERAVHYLLAISLPYDSDVDVKCELLGEILLEALDAGKACQ